MQVLRVDYMVTNALVVQMITTGFLIHIINSLYWETHQIDITGAYLLRDLDEYLNIEQLPRYSDDKSKVCKLQTARYSPNITPKSHKLKK
jgi:hypothetical protein